MNKVKIFHDKYFYDLEDDVNTFALNHKIINTNTCVEKYGCDVYYTIVVLYEEN